MRNIHMHYVKLIVTLMLAVLVGACGESTAPSSSKNEAASTTKQSFVESKKRADSGDADAQVNLGLLYAKGEGVPKDYAQVRQWYEKGAAQGHAGAQNNLGELYEFGHDVARNDVLAYMWYTIAAAHSVEDEWRDLAAENRDEIAGHMTSAQIADAKKRAREWKPTGK